MILEISGLDLEVAEARLGPFHETSIFFRAALSEARRSWDRLRALYGGAALEAALAEPPVTALTIGEAPDGGPAALFVPIRGRTYRAEQIPGTRPAPVQWRLTRVPDPGTSPYYACRLGDGSLQCDCAEWAYLPDDLGGSGPCKHLEALRALGWI